MFSVDEPNQKLDFRIFLLSLEAHWLGMKPKLVAKILKRLETLLELSKFIEFSPLTQYVSSSLVLSFQPSVFIQLQASSIKCDF